LLLLAGATGGLAVGAATIASARVVAAPASASGGTGAWIPIGKLIDFPEGAPRRVTVVADEKDGFSTAKHQPLGVAYVVRKGEQLTAFSATCPHLGCLVDASSQGFHCPCHDSTFALDGSRAASAGAKPNASLRDLDSLATRLTGKDDDRVVELEWRRFALGTAKKESVG
jgi:menaquinol-cytochrome c reductase iron-sulfur subunit